MALKKLSSLLVLFSINILFITNVQAQILKDKEAYLKIEQGVYYIYNCEFDKAEEVYKYINNKYPNHSVPHLFKGLILYWKYLPMIPGSEENKEFVNEMSTCIDLAEKAFKENDSDAENLLAGLGAMGMLLMYYADNDLTGKVISLAPETFHFVMKAFNFTDTYHDFYYITGLYNYYREAYPEAHPVYKPMLIFFPKGDKKLGLEQLKIAARSSIFLKAESNSFLSGIYLNFERDPDSSLVYSNRLISMYPNNVQYKTLDIRNLLLLKKYNRAESILDSINYWSVNTYFQAKLDIFRAILYEKVDHNDTMAEYYYLSGIRKAEKYGEYANEYISYGYFGLSRIYDRAGDKKKGKQYLKLAEDNTVYEFVNFNN